MRDRSRISKNYFRPFRLAHRARAALRALARRWLAVSFCARAFPPLSPPSRPSATAAAFFVILAIPGRCHIPVWSESWNSCSRRPDHALEF